MSKMDYMQNQFLGVREKLNSCGVPINKYDYLRIYFTYEPNGIEV